jgi:PAS domain S-box-containing protein
MSSVKTEEREETLNESLARDLQAANQQLLVRSLREEQHAEAAERAADQLRAVLENMDEGVAIFDSLGELQELNPAGRSILGVTAADALDEVFNYCTFRWTDGPPLDVRQELIGRMLHGDHLVEERLTVVRRDGTARKLSFSGRAVLGDLGHSVLAFAVFRDVTAIRELELARAQFLSLISHDLRGPLAVGRLSAQLIGRTEDPQRRASLLRRVDASLERMDQMIETLLDTERLRAGEALPLHLSGVDLMEVAEEVVSEQRALHGEQFVLEGPSPVAGHWDRSQVRRAIWNLVSNAVKYGEEGGVVTLRCESDGTWAAISVHNFGSAIPLAEQTRLFAPFARSPAAMQSGPQGWGLGLTMVRGCAQAHGGTISVHSEPEKGTTFTLRLPLES